MSCDLDKTVGTTCILRSPSIPDTFDWTCVVVSYSLSSRDVNLTLELLVDDVVNISETLSADEYKIFIPNRNWGSPVRLQLTATRYLVSAVDYEFALVTSVNFLPCRVHSGRLLCLKAILHKTNAWMDGWILKLKCNHNDQNDIVQL